MPDPAASAGEQYLSAEKRAGYISFNDDGTQVLPVSARIGGQAKGLNALLKSCGWEAVSNDDDWKLLTISAGQV